MTADLGPADHPRPIPTTEDTPVTDQKIHPSHDPTNEWGNTRCTNCRRLLARYVDGVTVVGAQPCQQPATAPYDAGDAAPATGTPIRTPTPTDLLGLLDLLGEIQQRADTLAQVAKDAADEVDAVETALTRAGHDDRTASLAALVDRLAAERDQARRELNNLHEAYARATTEREQARADLRQLRTRYDLARRQRDEALEARDVLRHQLDQWQATYGENALRDAQAVIAENRSLRAELEQAVARLDHDAWNRLTAERDRYRDELRTVESMNAELATQRDQARQLAESRQRINDSLRQDLSDAGDVIAAIRGALAAYDTPPTVTPPSLGSPATRAQAGCGILPCLPAQRLQQRIAAEVRRLDRDILAVSDRVDEMQMVPEYNPADDVDTLLANVARSLASADNDDERAEAVEMLLSGWYAAWPQEALTDPDAPLAAELVRLLGTTSRAQVPAEPTWDDCATVADALTAAPGTGEIWRTSYGDITGAPLSLARVAVEALAKAGRIAVEPPARPAQGHREGDTRPQAHKAAETAGGVVRAANAWRDWYVRSLLRMQNPDDVEQALIDAIAQARCGQCGMCVECGRDKPFAEQAED